MELDGFVETGLGRYVQPSAIPKGQHQYVYDELCALALNILIKLGNDPTRSPTDMGEFLSWMLEDIPAHVAFIWLQIQTRRDLKNYIRPFSQNIRIIQSCKKA